MVWRRALYARWGDSTIAMWNGHDILKTSPLEIANYKSSEPQPLPSIGVIARLADVAPQPDGALQVVLDVTTRATITARLPHDPYYLVQTQATG
jgi:ATP-dependent Lon protease